MPKKTESGDPLVSPGTICYAEKQEKHFWFSSLGQTVQFDTIKFRRNFKNYFSQFVWIEKKKKRAPSKNIIIEDHCSWTSTVTIGKFLEKRFGITPSSHKFKKLSEF